MDGNARMMSAGTCYRILAFSFYAAAVPAIYATCYYLWPPFSRPQQSTSAYLSELLTLCPLAAISFAAASLIARTQDKAVDGIAAAILGWLLFCATGPVFIACKAVIAAFVFDPFESSIRTLFDGFGKAVLAFVLMLVISAPVATAAIAVYQLSAWVWKRLRSDSSIKSPI
jgi:hypothetical protein